MDKGFLQKIGVILQIHRRILQKIRGILQIDKGILQKLESTSN